MTLLPNPDTKTPGDCSGATKAIIQLLTASGPEAVIHPRLIMFPKPDVHETHY